MVISQFAALNNKLGQFEGMWNKLIEDVKALHKYLENPSPWLTAQVRWIEIRHGEIVH